MAFNWPAKKDVREPGAKPEFPAALEADIAEPAGGKGPNPLRSVAREVPSRPAATAGDAEALAALTERLENLGQLLDQAKDQVTSYLLHRESQSSGGEASKALARKVDALAERLEQGSGGGRGLEQKIEALHGKIDQLANATPRGTSAGAASGGNGGGQVAGKLEQFEGKLKSIDTLKDALLPAITKLRDSLAEHHNAQSVGIRQLSEMMSPYLNTMAQYLPAIQQQVAAAQQRADAGLRTIIDILRPPAPAGGSPEAASAGAAVSGDWQEALLGGALAHNAALNADKNKLLKGVLSGDPGACSLVGSLLLFRSAAADKMPPLLKDIGEAFYRWQPRASNRPGELEKSLVAWLVRACDQAGMANTIELVNPGERFDSLRHNAPRPGVEVTQVLGWIVLRDNGRVYTKAAVAVK